MHYIFLMFYSVNGRCTSNTFAFTPVAAEDDLANEVDATLPVGDRDETVANDKENKTGI